MIRIRYKRNKKRDLSVIDLGGPKKVKVGFPSGEASGDIINRAIWNHFGTSRGIPERPFLSNAIKDNKSKYRAAIKTAAKQILEGTTTLRAVLTKLGMASQADIQKEITNLSSPPNAPSTIAAKGSSNPLVDTGDMKGAVTYKVDES